MGKGSIARILLLWETVITYGLTTGTGLLLGMVLYKLAELGMVRLLQVPVTYTLTVSVSSLLAAAALFAAIHTLILLNSLRQLHGVSAVGLLRSESVGEKPPKAQWVLTAAGAVLLGAAYALAVSIREPLAALTWFFAAVLMVIAATYLLFISGSVTLCRGLQRNKKILLPAPALRVRGVHGLPHEAQRRGTGVGVHSGHHGAGDDLVHHLPVCGAGGRGECPVSPRHGRGGIRQKRSSAGRGGGGAAASGCGEHRFQLRRPYVQHGGYRELSVSGLPDGGDLRLGNAGASAADSTRVTQLHFLPLEEYNAATGQSLTLKDGQVYVATLRMDFDADTLSIDGGMTRHVMKREITPLDGAAVANITPSVDGGGAGL